MDTCTGGGISEIVVKRAVLVAKRRRYRVMFDWTKSVLAGPNMFTTGGAKAPVPVGGYNLAGGANVNFGALPGAALPGAIQNPPPGAQQTSNNLAGGAIVTQNLQVVQPIANNQAGGANAQANHNLAAPPVVAVVNSKNQAIGAMAGFNGTKVDDILTAWKKTLKERIGAFKDEASKVAAWEADLRQQQAYMETLERDITKLEMQRVSLMENYIEPIMNFQSELDDNLNTLNNDIISYIQTASIPLPNDCDLARDNILKVVEELEGQLELMECNIESIVKEFNNSNQNTDNSALGKILSILNKHHQNLMWLDEQSKELKGKIDRLNVELKIQSK